MSSSTPFPNVVTNICQYLLTFMLHRFKKRKEHFLNTRETDRNEIRKQNKNGPKKCKKIQIKKR